jgi:hypothetical protein
MGRKVSLEVTVVAVSALVEGINAPVTIKNGN